MMPPNYTRAWAETDIVLHTVLGLVIALDDIVSQSDAIPPDHYDGPVISALLSVIREKTKALPDLRELEWDHVAAAMPGTSKAPAARGDGAQASRGCARTLAGDHPRLERQPAG